jgi:ArsR family transcriptional regulator
MSSDGVKRKLFEHVAAVARAFGSAPRLELLDFLAQSERSVEVLAELAGLSVTNASQHLQHLRRAGLVLARRRGKQVLYRLVDAGVVEATGALRRLAQQRNIEVEQVLATFFHARDDMEAVPRRELLKRMRQNLVTVLDVRPPEEFAAGHLPGAINVLLTDLKRRLRDLPRKREIVAYCRGPYCVLAYEAVAALRPRGFKIRRLEDGYPEWRAAGLPVETGTEAHERAR